MRGSLCHVGSSALLALGLLTLGTLAGAVASPDPAAQAPRKGNAQAPSKILGITSFSFLAGTWSSTTDEGIAEEMWSAPRGESLMGCFRWCDKEGATKMVELLSIAREKDAVRMRLRHFSDTLVAKEAGDKPITLKLEQMVGEKFTFRAESNAGDVESIVYELKSDTLVVDVTFKAGEKPRDPLHFEMQKLN